LTKTSVRTEPLRRMRMCEYFDFSSSSSVPSSFESTTPGPASGILIAAATRTLTTMPMRMVREREHPPEREAETPGVMLISGDRSSSENSRGCRARIENIVRGGRWIQRSQLVESRWEEQVSAVRRRGHGHWMVRLVAHGDACDCANFGNRQLNGKA